MVVLKPTGPQIDVQTVEQATYWGRGGESSAALRLSSRRKRDSRLKPIQTFLREAMSALQMMDLL